MTKAYYIKPRPRNANIRDNLPVPRSYSDFYLFITEKNYYLIWEKNNFEKDKDPQIIEINQKYKIVSDNYNSYGAHNEVILSLKHTLKNLKAITEEINPKQFLTHENSLIRRRIAQICYEDIE